MHLAAYMARETYDYIVFIDSAIDSSLFCNLNELIARFKSFKHPMVVSGEVFLWPYPALNEHIRSATAGHYPYPGSCGYMAEIPYLLELFDAMAIQWKSDCVEDQGEFIKALAANNDAFKIDHDALLFQSSFGLRSSIFCIRVPTLYMPKKGIFVLDK